MRHGGAPPQSGRPGAFGGAKAFFEHTPPGRVDGVMIGYPGLDHIVTGGRGVLRARLHVHGVAGHSGASKALPSAIAKAAELISRLENQALAEENTRLRRQLAHALGAARRSP